MSEIPRLQGALIGCGFVSQHHLRAWQMSNRASIAALCDLDPERLEKASLLAPGAKVYQDADSLFAREKLDFIEICTRPSAHLTLVSMAARHGVHVLCQKPAAESRAELEQMISECRSAGVRLMFHENWRFRAWNRKLGELIGLGTIGSVVRLRIAHRDTRALRPEGFDDQPYFREMPRLILFEMGCHLIDTARFLAGEVSEVSAILGRFGSGHVGEDVATLSLRFESGALGLLDITWCATAEHARPEWALNETVVEGVEGSLRLRLDGSIDLDRHGRPVERIEVDLPDQDHVYLQGYIAAQDHFINGILTGDAHETSGEDTLKTMDVVWSGYESAAHGRVIRLPRSRP